LAGVYGDRIVLRSFSPLRTIAGGKLVNPLGRKVKRFSKELEILGTLVGGTAEELVLGQLALAGSEGVGFARLLVLTNLESRELDRVLQGLSNRQDVFVFDREGRVYVSGALVGELAVAVLSYLAAFHKREPMRPGLSRGELASTWGKALPPKLFHFVLERLLKKGEIASEGEVLRLPGHKVSLASDQAALRERILAAYEQGGVTPPNLKDVLGPLDVPAKEAMPLFKVLQDEGRLVKINEDMFFAAGSFEELKRKVIAFFDGGGELDPNELRNLTGLSRKYAIPLLEHFDKEKLTVRVGDKRRLRKR
jgi:selenocysteine-specific elongation factor